MQHRNIMPSRKQVVSVSLTFIATEWFLQLKKIVKYFFDISGRLVAARDEHGSGLDRTGTGLKPIVAESGLDQTAIFFKIGRSGLDRTENIFVVFM